MSKVKAPNATGQLGAVARRRTVRLSRRFAHGSREERCVAAPAFESPSFGTDSEDLRKVSSRQR
jgi:hypothetical protein